MMLALSDSDSGFLVFLALIHICLVLLEYLLLVGLNNFLVRRGSKKRVRATFRDTMLMRGNTSRYRSLLLFVSVPLGLFGLWFRLTGRADA